MLYAIRDATPEDVAACLAIRGRTRENAISVSELQAIGVTQTSWSEGVRKGTLFGRVCICEDLIVGYCYADAGTGEIVVLAVLPEHEGRGIGKALLTHVTSMVRDAGFAAAWLGASRNESTRSYGFYRHLGWTPTGQLDARGDQILSIEL